MVIGPNEEYRGILTTGSVVTIQDKEYDSRSCAYKAVNYLWASLRQEGSALVILILKGPLKGLPEPVDN